MLIGSLALIEFLLRRLGRGGQILSEGQNSLRLMNPDKEHYWPQPGRFPFRIGMRSLTNHSTPETMSRFIGSASPEDAGHAAALDIFGIDLTEVLSGLLKD